MITRSYDAVIVGPSAGSLTAAALLAARGLQVLAVDRREGRPAAGRYTFPSHTRPVMGFEGGTLLPAVLRALQVHPREMRLLRRARPGYQVISPRHRIDVHADADALYAELERELPAELPALARFLSRAEEAGEAYAQRLLASAQAAGQLRWWHRVGLGRMPWSPPLPGGGPTFVEAARQEGMGDEGLRFLLAQVRPFSWVEGPGDLPLPMAAIPLMASFDGWFTDPDEPDAFQAMLRRRVEGLKVDLLSEPDPEEVIARWRRVRELRFSTRPEPVSTSALILGMAPESLAPALSERAGAAYRAASAVLRATRFRYSLYLGLRKEVVPVGMGDHAIFCARDDEPVEGVNCLLISLSAEDQIGVAPEGCRAMTVSADLPLAEAADPGALDARAREMLTRVKELVPFLERYLEVLHIPRPGPVGQENPLPVDATPAVFAGDPGAARLPTFGGMGVHLPHRNAFYAGRASMPALGIEGEVLSGMVVDRLVKAVLPRKR